MMKRRMGALALLFLGVGALLDASDANAGSAPLAVRLVNMTPDPVDDAGRACSAAIRRVFRAARDHDSDEGVAMVTQGETALRTQLASADLPPDFMSWPAAPVDALRERTHGDDYFQALVLFDCRPSDNVFRAAVFPNAGGVTHTRVSQIVTSDGFAEWMSARLIEQAWIGFVP
ncbi:MAG: hypothetical protein AAF938_17770 [Myxococcota bacterium]